MLNPTYSFVGRVSVSATRQKKGGVFASGFFVPATATIFCAYWKTALSRGCFSGSVSYKKLTLPTNHH
ncbi:hypothetical protein ACVGWN_13735, partial [Enterobacter hormaechei]